MSLILPEGYEENNPKILKQVRKDLKENNAFHYIFIGKVGCGKTYLANQIVQSRKDFGSFRWSIVECRHLYQEYLRVISSNFTDKYDAIRNLESTVKDRLTFIDDLGDERPGTDAAHDYMSGRLMDRWEKAKRDKDSCTIITTNLSQADIIKKYGSRVVDRMEEVFTLMIFKPHSFRRDKRIIIEG
jgi:DNA replication protein DnaC